MGAHRKKGSIGVAFITHKAKHHLPKCLPPFLQASLPSRVVVVNSSSHDGTVELAKEMGADIFIVPRAHFNHGATREEVRRYLNTEIVVMVTPDAYALDNQVLERLVTPLLENRASVSYARQIPHDGASIMEAFPREFNYPSTSELRSLDDISKHGIYTFFCSDTCAAYLNSALDEIGGFSPTLFGEDTVAVAKLLRKGHKIAYAADAVVKHSHKYSLMQEFRRHFDIGLARKGYRHLLEGAGKDSQRGKKFVQELLKKLFKESPKHIPYACVQTLFKFAGYKIGQASHKGPFWLKKRLSSQDFYWDSIYGIAHKSNV